MIGGELNKDKNIYVYSKDKDGNYTIKGESIGVTTTAFSFYNSDKGEWSIDAVINPGDKSGIDFLDEIASKNPTLGEYIPNAKKNQRYDFKVTNGKDYPNNELNPYRGMPVGVDAKTGVVTYSSARDVGNIVAGYMAGINGIPWILTRAAFDGYQSKQSGHPDIEGRSTRSAQFYGWKVGSTINQLQKRVNLARSIISITK